MRFVWDPIKAKNNFKKHKVAFEEAATVFLDYNAIQIHDTDHSFSEQRWILLGLSHNIRILVVVHVEVEENVIRLVSARKANSKEIKTYVKRRA